MIQYLLKFLGVKIDAAQEVTSVSLVLRQASWLGWVVFIALLLGAYTWWAYRFLAGHRHLERGRRYLLTGLRILLFLLLLFILLRPVFSFTIETRLRRTLVVLMDKSGSMNIEDLRREDADIKRAAIGKGMIERLDQSLSAQQASEAQHVSRTGLVKAVFENTKLDLVNNLEKIYDIEYYDFNRAVKETGREEALKTPPGDDDNTQATAIGDAIRDVINRKRGQPVTGILMVTDGANNSGSEPLDAATAARQEHMPLYIYGVGITSPRDVIVDSVFTPEVAFIKDEVPVTVRVRAQSLKGEKGRLSLRLDGEEVAAKDVDYNDDGEQAVAMTFTPEKAGEFELTATIPPREDETVKDNNTASQRLRVIDSKIKVLYIEQAPRWEFRFIQSALMRDRRVDAKFILLQGDPELAKAEGSPYLAKFPDAKEDLFKYDLVVIGDVDPKTFSPDQMDAMTEFVSKFGGAMIFIAGQQFDPAGYTNTPFVKLLPVESALANEARDSGDHPTTLALTTLGRANPMLKLAPDEQENAAIWKNFPPVHWVNRVSRAKPAAQVLLEDTDPAKASRYGKMPVMALQQYGIGQVLYIGTDDTWRWRQETGVAYYPLLWGQIVQRMALAHLLGGSKRMQLSVDKQRYTTGERVTVFARLYDQNFEPVKQPSVNAIYTVRAAAGQPEAPKQSLQLRALPGQPGMYRGDFVPITPGLHTLHVESDPKTTIDFTVTKPQFELGETAMNEPVLKAMARISGGGFFREEDLANLTQAISQKDERLSRIVDADIWSSPFYFLLVVAVAVVEWVLRKKSELK